MYIFSYKYFGHNSGYKKTCRVEKLCTFYFFSPFIDSFIL